MVQGQTIQDVPKKFALKSWSSLGGVLTFPLPLHADQVEFLWSETAGGWVREGRNTAKR